MRDEKTLCENAKIFKQDIHVNRLISWVCIRDGWPQGASHVAFDPARNPTVIESLGIIGLEADGFGEIQHIQTSVPGTRSSKNSQIAPQQSFTPLAACVAGFFSRQTGPDYL